LEALDSAAKSFSIAIDQQWTIAQSDPSPATLAENTIAYASAKISYYTALREAMPGLANIATGREPRPPQDKFHDAFEPAGLREIAAEKATAALLQRYGAEPDVQKAATEFDHAQKLEEIFLKDFEGQDFTRRRFTTGCRYRRGGPGRGRTPSSPAGPDRPVFCSPPSGGKQTHADSRGPGGP
jgi:hypothetical protein